MASFAGIRGTGKFATDELPKNFREAILFLNPNGMSPLSAIMARARSEATDSVEINWWEEKLNITRLRLNDASDMSASDTAVVVDSGALALVIGDVLQVEPAAELEPYVAELVSVGAVASDTAFTIVRGVAGTTAAIILDNAFFTRMGSAFEEGTNPAGISQRNPTKLTNYAQIFKTSVGLTKTAEKEKTRTGDPFLNDKKRKMFDHAVGIEFALMFGVPFEDTTGAHPKRYVGGLRNFITTNSKVYTTTPTENDVLDDFHKVFDFEGGGAGDERIVLAGNGFLNSLSKLARDSASTQINYTGGKIDMYGMNLQKWIFPQGTFGIKSHPLMNIHPRWKNSAFIIDPSGLVWRPFRDTKFNDNVQANGKDSREGEWLSEISFEVNHEETMAYIGNFVV